MAAEGKLDDDRSHHHHHNHPDQKPSRPKQMSKCLSICAYVLAVRRRTKFAAFLLILLSFVLILYFSWSPASPSSPSSSSHSSSSSSSSTSSSAAQPWRLTLWLSETNLGAFLPAWLHAPASLLLARSAPSVTLKQGTVVGKVITEASYPQPLEAFLGVPYAHPAKRFAHAEPVKSSDKVIDASNFGLRCPAGPLTMPATEWGEDCLNANIYRPKGYEGKKLPVAAYIHGGAFNGGKGHDHNTPSMLAWSEKPFIGINFNYRLGAFGFLPSNITAKAGLLNIGLYDQMMLFEWIQDNIHKFGGDPDEVTIFGLSAGAHSIGHHVMHETDRKLFSRVLIESGATTARAVLPYDASLHEVQFDDFLLEAGCFEASDDEVIKCLRDLDLLKVAQASVAIHNHYEKDERYAFQPVIDGKMIRQAPLKSWKSGKWNKIPIMTGFTTDEGAPFTSTSTSTSKEFTDHFKALIPALPQSDLRLLDKIYPDPLVDSSSPYVETRPIDVGAQFKRTTAAYGQWAYICPVQQTAYLASAGQSEPVFLYHWALNRTVQNGAGHGDQTEYEVYSKNVREISEAQDEVAGQLHAYFTSFITTGDPNKIEGRYADRPKWKAFNSKSPKPVMIMGKGNDERAGGQNVGVSAEHGDLKWCRKECRFWWERTLLSEK